jgi:hypothetical protein
MEATRGQGESSSLKAPNIVRERVSGGYDRLTVDRDPRWRRAGKEERGRRSRRRYGSIEPH